MCACAGSAAIPIVYFESLVRRARKDDPGEVIPLGLLSNCMHLHDFLLPALGTLIAAGLLTDELVDNPDGLDFYSFPTYGALQAEADRLVEANKDDATLRLSAGSFDALDACPAPGTLAWVEGMHIGTLLDYTGDAAVYVDLVKILGGRDRNATRHAAGSQLFTMAGSPTGGELLDTVRSHFAMGAASAGFVVGRVPEFLSTTAWPFPYDLEHTNTLQYAYDVSARAQWPSATEAQWRQLVTTKLCRAVKRLSQLSMVTHSCSDSAATLIRDIERLGKAALTGTGDKMVLWRINELEEILAADYAGAIEVKYDEGVPTTQIINDIIKLLPG